MNEECIKHLAAILSRIDTAKLTASEEAIFSEYAENFDYLFGYDHRKEVMQQKKERYYICLLTLFFNKMPSQYKSDIYTLNVDNLINEAKKEAFHNLKQELIEYAESKEINLIQKKKIYKRFKIVSLILSIFSFIFYYGLIIFSMKSDFLLDIDNEMRSINLLMLSFTISLILAFVASCLVVRFIKQENSHFMKKWFGNASGIYFILPPIANAPLAFLILSLIKKYNVSLDQLYLTKLLILPSILSFGVFLLGFFIGVLLPFLTYDFLMNNLVRKYIGQIN